MELIEETNSHRQRSARRLRHEAEVRVFQDKTGDIERIRNALGLRPSQICEILKVHPSAWTRWIKTQRVPPHVYQMLEWYLELLKWRGQNHPLGSSQNQIQPLRKQDPTTYVPEKEPFDPRPMEKIEKPRKNWLERPFFTHFLITIWLFETTLLSALIIYLVKQL